MWTKLAIIAMLIVLFICTVYFSSSKRKEKLFLNKIYIYSIEIIMYYYYMCLNLQSLI